MTVNVSISEAEAQLSRLLERVARGERVVISSAGRPVADLVPHQRTQIVLGGMRGQLSYDDDSFAEPDPDIQRMFYGDAGATPLTARRSSGRSTTTHVSAPAPGSSSNPRRRSTSGPQRYSR